MRIGRWGRHVHYLETHLIGDPTYRFVNRVLPGTDLNTLTAKASDNKYWLGWLPKRCQPRAGHAQAADNGYGKTADLCENGLPNLLTGRCVSKPSGDEHQPLAAFQRNAGAGGGRQPRTGAPSGVAVDRRLR